MNAQTPLTTAINTKATEQRPTEAEIQAAYESHCDLVRSALKYDLRADKHPAVRIAARLVIDRIEAAINTGVPLATAFDASKQEAKK